MAYDRKNPVYAVGKRGYDIARRSGLRGEKYLRNYDRVMSVVERMQQRMQQASSGNSNS